MAHHRVVVIGGNNVDITATSTTPLVYGDSNPGSIHTGLGGVARNIAENLTRLQQQTSLVSVFGDDEFARLALAQAKEIGLDLSLSQFVANAASSVYVCINEPGGDMSVAVNDMALCERMTPGFFEERLDVLNTADAIVLDANLPELSVDYLVQHCTPPIFADAVSAKKAPRLHRSLPRLKTLKANQIEVELLTGVSITDEHSMADAARLLHQMGVEMVLITLGRRGAFASDGNTQVFERPLPLKVVNTTGCGDAFMAAATLAVLEKRGAAEVLRQGLAAAALCAQSERAVSEQLSPEALAAILQSIQP